MTAGLAGSFSFSFKSARMTPIFCLPEGQGSKIYSKGIIQLATNNNDQIAEES